MNKDYPKKIFWSTEDSCYVVTFPDFPNLSAFGDTEEEALSDANEVLLMAIESLEEDGIQLPVPKRGLSLYSGQVRLRMPGSLHEKLAVAAEQDGVSLNTYMVCKLSENNASARVEQTIKQEIASMCNRQDYHFTILKRSIEETPTVKGSSSSRNWSTHIPRFMNDRATGVGN